ncbi:DUF3489 domain-containing protein [Rhodobacteraceae bacterium]|nr:DUF3489 domain-containing protein [Paracoccaceae bacterium]
MTTSTKPSDPKTTSKTRTTKKAILIKLLSTKNGSDIASLSDKLGWQQHTTRAVISGLRKAGYEVSNQKPTNGGPSKYRILSASNSPTTQTSAGTPHGA